MNWKLEDPLSVIVRAGRRVIVKLLKMKRPAASRSPIFKEDVLTPDTSGGVPLIKPVGLRLKPAGSVPLCRLQTYPVPPAACNCAL